MGPRHGKTGQKKRNSEELIGGAGARMKKVQRGLLVAAVVSSGFLAACASTGTTGEGGSRQDVLTREDILGAEATNLYDVIRRLRPRWLQVRSSRSLNMETEIAVLQNDMYLGTTEALKEMAPELAYGIRYLEGARAATAIPGLMSGRHIEGAIIINTRPGGGGGG